jgi:hypothetical protein
MKLSLSQAAKEAGKSKSRISAAIKSGELAAVRSGNKFQIDPSELFRVFPKPSAVETEIGLNVSSELSELRQNFAVLEASSSKEIELLKAQLEDRQKEILRMERIYLAAPVSERKSLLDRVFGR